VFQQISSGYAPQSGAMMILPKLAPSAGRPEFKALRRGTINASAASTTV
jgi:hypothetical protein